MRSRSTLIFAVIVTIATTSAGVPVAQQTAQSQPIAERPTPERRWTIVRTNRRNFSGPNGYHRSQSKVRVSYKETYELTPAGYVDWVAGYRAVTWEASSVEASFDNVHIDKVHGRSRADSEESCMGSSYEILEPGPSGLTAEERAKFQTSCQTTVSIRGGGPGGGTTSSVQDGLVLLPVRVAETDLTNCRYREERPLRRLNEFEVETLTVSLSEPVHATLQYSSADDKKFVPAPGKVVRVTAQSPTPVRWQFELFPVSTLRGYATNADVDKAFFELYDVPFHHQEYGNLDPDLVFSPRTYQEPADARKNWKLTGLASKWSRLESRTPRTAATVEVTAMDFGARGKIGAYVKPPCGDWTEVGTPLGLPVDDNNNALPDAMPSYDSAAPGDDHDFEPAGDGTSGDGFTVFEEYRGFVFPTDYACQPTRIAHWRTSPRRKDLFVRADGHFFGSWAKDHFGFRSGLEVHIICPAQYLNDNTRVVNFTMQINPGWDPSVPRLTQRMPQHGVRLVDERLPRGQLGNAGTVGTPGMTEKVVVDVRQILEAYRGTGDSERMLLGIMMHELAHAVNIPHHGVGNVVGPFVIVDPVNCPAGITEGTVDGRPACMGTGLAEREAENSGRHTCPMKYVDWNWYAAGSQRLTERGEVTFNPLRGFPWTRVRRLPAFSGRIARYLEDQDDMGIEQFCTDRKGTGVNELPHDRNHAGRNLHICMDQLRVNDVPTVR